MTTSTDFTAALRPGPDTVDLTNDFADRTAIVTGGASGIGNAIAHALAGRGARVAVLDVRADGAAAAAAELPEVATGVHGGFGCDVTDEDSVTGTYRVAQAVGRHMLGAGYGRIVNIASQAAHVGIDGHAAYCASKAGVTGLTRVLALEWGGRGVTVNTVSPTVVLTDLGRAAWANENGLRHQDEIPTGRFATPDEVAAAVLFLAGASSAMVNGTDLRVDGGFTIR